MKRTRYQTILNVLYLQNYVWKTSFFCSSYSYRPSCDLISIYTLTMPPAVTSNMCLTSHLMQLLFVEKSLSVQFEQIVQLNSKPSSFCKCFFVLFAFPKIPQFLSTAPFSSTSYLISVHIGYFTFSLYVGLLSVVQLTYSRSMNGLYLYLTNGQLNYPSFHLPSGIVGSQQFFFISSPYIYGTRRRPPIWGMTSAFSPSLSMPSAEQKEKYVFRTLCISSFMSVTVQNCLILPPSMFPLKSDSQSSPSINYSFLKNISYWGLQT